MKKTAFFLLIISIIIVFSACGAEKEPEIVLAEQTEYVRPQCREVINDDELIKTVSNLKDNGKHVYIGEGGQLQSPVCIILYDIGEDEYSFLTTKLFDTVNNPAEARTILLVNAKWWNFQHEKNNARVYDYNPSYGIYVCTPDFSTYTHLYNYEPDFVLTSALGYKAHFTQELDESLLKFILETYSVSPDADNVINDALSFFAQYKPENDIAFIKEAVKDYDYPEDKDISKNADLLDTSVPLYNYRITEYESAVLAQGDTYVRPDEVFSQIEDYDRVFNDEANDLYADMYNKRCDRYISITEYSGYSSLGTYYYENGKSTEVFTLIGRMTIVNSDTGEIVGWYELPAVNTDPEKINTKNIKKINELNIVVNYSASETIIEKLYGDIDYSQIGFS